MVIIDPEGMFCGDRMAKLSDQAKLHWPWLFLASNGYGRLEINYRLLRSRVFGAFVKPPTEEQFMSLIREYHDAYLLFLYVENNQMWGQWDTSEKFLPRYKTASDDKSPAPPQDEWVAWREEYAAARCEEVPDISTFSEKFRGSRNISKKFQQVGVGVGADVEAGANNKCASGDAPVDQPAAGTKRGIPESERRQWFEEMFWPNVWHKIGKGAARSAFLRKVKTVEDRDKVLAAAKTQGPSILERGSRPGCSILHPATWLNQERYDDEDGGNQLQQAPSLFAVSAGRQNVWDQV